MSAWGALPGLLLARFPRPLGEPVLSACDTAEAADGPALAHALVAGGIPAVVGMRRLVDLTDANRFCAALYPEYSRLSRPPSLLTDHQGPEPSIADQSGAFGVGAPVRGAEVAAIRADVCNRSSQPQFTRGHVM
jgi:hypothetical protein